MLTLNYKQRLCPQDYIILDAILSCTENTFGISDMVEMPEFEFLADNPEQAFNVFCSSVHRLQAASLVETEAHIEARLLDTDLFVIPMAARAAVTVPCPALVRVDHQTLANGQKGYMISFTEEGMKRSQR